MCSRDYMYLFFISNLLILSLCEKQDFSKHEFTYKNGSESIQFGRILAKTSTRLDYFYGIVGHRNPSAMKAQIDNFNYLSWFLQLRQRTVKAGVFNGDLPKPDHTPEPERSYWGSNDWIVDYGTQQLGVSWEQPQSDDSHDFKGSGIDAHSWRDCMPSLRGHRTVCLHMIQFRNYGNRFELSKLSTLFEWTKRKLIQADRAADQYLIVFQQFDSRLLALVEALSSENIVTKDCLGVFFALMQNAVNLDWRLCMDGISVPLVSMGILDDFEYVLMQFEPGVLGVKNLYLVSSLNSTTSYVRDYGFRQRPCLH